MNLPETDYSFQDLQDMICLLNDGKAMYEKAIERATEKGLKAYFVFLYKQRAAFANELNALLMADGINPKVSGTLKGKIFMYWMEVKSAFSGKEHENGHLISFCLFCERRLQQAYNELQTNTGLSKEKKFLITIQQQATKMALTKLHKMKNFDPYSPSIRFI